MCNVILALTWATIVLAKFSQYRLNFDIKSGFWGHLFQAPFVLTKFKRFTLSIFLDPQFFPEELSSPKIYFGHKFLFFERQFFFQIQTFFSPKILRPKILLVQKKFLNQNFFRPKFFQTKLFFRPTFFGTRFF